MDYGFLSLLPPLVAVVMAIKSKNVILSLFCGGFVGTLIFASGNPFLATKSIIGDYFFVQLTDSYNAGVIVLVIFIGGFIKLMEKSGGAQAFSKSVYKYVNTKLKAQLCAWVGGILIFFSDLGTPLLVGPVFRPLFDKLKISREKLAWILDSTSSPVAILIPFIGWGVYIMGLIQAEFDNLNVAQSDYATFVEAIPFQIYAILAIIMIPLVAFTKKDFSQMKKAETEAASGEYSFEEDLKAGTSNARPSMVIIPIIVVFATLFITLAPLGFPFKKVDGNAFRVALTMGYFFGAVLLMAMIGIYKVKDFKETFKIYVPYCGRHEGDDRRGGDVSAGLVSGKHDQRPGNCGFHCKRVKERQFFCRACAWGNLYFRRFCLLFHRKFLGDICHYDASGDPYGSCLRYPLRHCRGGGSVRRVIRRPLFAYFRYHHFIFHRSAVRSGGSCEDSASLCVRQRGDRFWGIYFRRLYQKPSGRGAGCGGFAWRDVCLGKERRGRCRA